MHESGVVEEIGKYPEGPFESICVETMGDQPQGVRFERLLLTRNI